MCAERTDSEVSWLQRTTSRLFRSHGHEAQRWLSLLGIGQRTLFVPGAFGAPGVIHISKKLPRRILWQLRCELSASDIEDKRMRILRDIDRLPARQRSMLLLYVQDGLTYRDIAVRNGIAPEVALGEVAAAYAQLRIWMIEEEQKMTRPETGANVDRLNS